MNEPEKKPNLLAAKMIIQFQERVKKWKEAKEAQEALFTKKEDSIFFYGGRSFKNYEEFEVEKCRLGKKLAMPAYKKFCRNNGLLFHFWDELPESSFNTEIAFKEKSLHWAASDLFNNQKKSFEVFENKIINYNINSSLEPEWEEYDIRDFIFNQEKEKLQLQKLVEKYRSKEPFIYIFLFAWVFVVIGVYYLVKYYDVTGSIFILFLIMPIPLINYFSNKLYNFKLTKKSQAQENQYTKELNELRDALKK